MTDKEQRGQDEEKEKWLELHDVNCVWVNDLYVAEFGSQLKIRKMLLAWNNYVLQVNDVTGAMTRD